MKMRAQPASPAHAHGETAKHGCAQSATALDGRCRRVAERHQSALSIEAARRFLASKFRRHGLGSPELDARLIIGHALALDHTALAAQAQRVLATEEAADLLQIPLGTVLSRVSRARSRLREFLLTRAGLTKNG